ncbi:MAG: hypothetical protein FJZ12_02185 [Candidatus Omnitrophica bacterium]|nr:hypothetical protein [Candidatus Omnitrophota bacterium]
MKNNILYAGLFLLAVVIIFIMVFGSEKAPEVSSPQVALKENAIVVHPASIEPSVTTSPSFSQQGITVIKPAQKIDPVISSEDISIPSSSQDSYDTIARSVKASGSTEIQDEEAISAGVTRVGKYPTKEEVKEMNSKGIVLY